MQSSNQKIQAVATDSKDIALKISNIIGKLEFADENDKEFSLSSYVYYLLKAAENSDQKLRADIENNIVKLGVKTVPYLIDALMTIKGTARGLAAMAIIRIGFSSVEILENTAEKTPGFAWMSEYIVNEILGTQIPVGSGNVTAIAG